MADIYSCKVTTKEGSIFYMTKLFAHALCKSGNSSNVFMDISNEAFEELIKYCYMGRFKESIIKLEILHELYIFAKKCRPLRYHCEQVILSRLAELVGNGPLLEAIMFYPEYRPDTHIEIRTFMRENSIILPKNVSLELFYLCNYSDIYHYIEAIHKWYHKHRVLDTAVAFANIRFTKTSAQKLGLIEPEIIENMPLNTRKRIGVTLLNHKQIDFAAKAKKIHPEGRYDYSLVEYRTRKDPVDIICNWCGNTFNVEPAKHLKGYGCPGH